MNAEVAGVEKNDGYWQNTQGEYGESIYSILATIRSIPN
jgi:hypothetical protein